MTLIYILAYSFQITGAIVLLMNSFGSTALAMQRAIEDKGKGGVLSGKILISWIYPRI